MRRIYKIMILSGITWHTIDYTFESLLMAIIASSLLLIIISICFLSKKIMINVGYKLLAVFLLLTLLRFAIPLELPFSINIYTPKKLLNAINFTTHVYSYIGWFPLSIWNCLIVIWIVGSVVKVVLFILSDRRFRKCLLLSGKDVTDTEPYKNILSGICTERNKKNNFRIVKVPDMDTPIIYGLFKPTIIIPSNLELSDDELYYTLSHEAAHHFHHDLFIILGVNILEIIYWWNPAVIILKSKATLLLEMRVDDYLTGRDRKTTISYLNCLIKIYEYAVEQKDIPSSSMTLSFNRESESDLSKRFDLMCNTNKTRENTLNVIMSASILIIYFFSYRYIFEPYKYPSEIESNYEERYSDYFLPLDSTYIIENADGTYDVYLDTEEMKDFYLETLESLDNYTQQGFTIYYLEKGNFK